MKDFKFIIKFDTDKNNMITELNGGNIIEILINFIKRNIDKFHKKIYFNSFRYNSL